MDEYSIIELQKRMHKKKVTAKRIMKLYLEKIKKIDKSGPRLNSIIEINPDALRIAEALDRERETSGPRSLLHGIPIVIKDNIDTADKMMTTAGSLALNGHYAKKDAFIVEQIRKAGGIILAKANLSEWANFRSTRSCSGWSSRGGLTRNPYVLDRSACGSSSGSAVAVAANLCSVAIGTETDGSIICPSQINGVVGFKPTLGLVSRSGIIPIAHSQDTAGPITRTVEDAAILLSIIKGKDSHDKITQNQKELDDFKKSLIIEGLEGIKVGVARNYFGSNYYVDKLMEQAIVSLGNLGAEVIDPANIELNKELRDTEYTVLLYEFKNDLNEYLTSLNDKMPARTLEEIIKFNEDNRSEVMPYFGQEHLINAQEKGSLDDEEYITALKKNHKFTRDEGIDKTMKKHNLDVIIAPSGSYAWTLDPISGDRFGGGSSSAAAVSGYPSITVPLGYIFGLPVGISFIGQEYQDSKLVQYAYAFEQATNVRKEPQFQKTIKFQ